MFSRPSQNGRVAASLVVVLRALRLSAPRVHDRPVVRSRHALDGMERGSGWEWRGRGGVGGGFAGWPARHAEPIFGPNAELVCRSGVF